MNRDQRQRLKAINFGMIYGMSSYKAQGLFNPWDSLGWCPWCQEIVECFERDWTIVCDDRTRYGKEGPECGSVKDLSPGNRTWCANKLTPLSGKHADAITASYKIGGIDAAREVWHAMGCPVLALDRRWSTPLIRHSFP